MISDMRDHHFSFLIREHNLRLSLIKIYAIGNESPWRVLKGWRAFCPASLTSHQHRQPLPTTVTLNAAWPVSTQQLGSHSNNERKDTPFKKSWEASHCNNSVLGTKIFPISCCLLCENRKQEGHPDVGNTKISSHDKLTAFSLINTLLHVTNITCEETQRRIGISLAVPACNTNPVGWTYS